MARVKQPAHPGLLGDAARITAALTLSAVVLSGINPNHAQPWIGIEGFRIERFHAGIALSDENDPALYTVLTPARDAWVFSGDRVDWLAGFEEFPVEAPRPPVGVLELISASLGSGRPRFTHGPQGALAFEASREAGDVRITKVVRWPRGERPRAYLHGIAPGPGHKVFLDGAPILPAGPDSPRGRRRLRVGGDVTIVALETGRSLRVQVPPGSGLFYDDVLALIEVESPVLNTPEGGRSEVRLTPLPRKRSS